MKNSSARAQGSWIAITAAFAATLIPTLGRAQSNQTWDGGTNTWDAGITQDWDSGTDTWTNGNNATFYGGTANVSGTVVVTQINTGGTGTTTISGGTVDFSGVGGGYTSISDFGGPLTISSQIETGPSGGDVQYFVSNYNNSDLTIGNINFNLVGSDGRFQLGGNDTGGSITLNGTYTNTSGAAGSIGFGNNGAGTYTLTPTADFTNFNSSYAPNTGPQNNSFTMTGDVLNIETSKFSGNQQMSFYNVSPENQVNIVGSQNIALNIYSSQKNDNSLGDDPDNISTAGLMKFTQSTTDQSTWSGNVNQNGANVVLGAVAGGRLNWAANLESSTPDGLVVNPSTADTGVVVLSGNANYYGLADGNGIVQPSSTVAATIEHGTVLITNPLTGVDPSNNPVMASAFGQNNGTVNVQAGATLGGTGSTIAGQTVMAAAGSRIAPGDPGQTFSGTPHEASVAASIGTLHLRGGLTVSGGGTVMTAATLAFKLDGDGSSHSNDSIDLGTVGNLTLSGHVTFNFSKLNMASVVQIDTPYTLAYNVAVFSDAGATLSFNAPAHYFVSQVNLPYTNGNGDFMTVEFEVPEPSTYALMLGGLAVLGFCLRRKNAALRA